jgi:MFS family permease
MSRVAILIRRLRENRHRQTRLVQPGELPAIMRKHIFTGAMGAVYFVLLSDMYLITFGNEMGMRYWQWGLLSALSSFVLVLQLVSALLVARTGRRKVLWYTSALAARILRAAAVTLAFLLSSKAPALARGALITLLVVSSAFDAFATPPWFSWLADIIPRQEHGRFMGRRSAWIALANMSVLVPIGYGIDRVGPQWKMTALMALFGFAFAVGVLDLVIHRTIPEPPMPLPPRRRFWHEVIVPLRDPRFRPWLTFNACWNFGMTVGGPLATVYFVENLGIKRNFLGGSIVLMMLPMMGTILAGKTLGVLVDYHGIKRCLWWGHSFWAVLPLYWIFATPSTALWWLGVSALTGSLSSTLAVTAANKLITRLPPSESIPMYVAVSACVGSLTGGLGPLLGGLILHAAEGNSWTIGTFTFVGFHILFVLSLILRGLSTFLIRKVEEPHLEPALIIAAAK